MIAGHATYVRLEHEEDGAIARLVLSAGKGNVLDRATLAALAEAHLTASRAPRVRAILLDHEGPHFSYGASVREHLPDTLGEMLRGLHRLILQIVRSEVPVIACIRGVCLGGGLELALACHRIVAAPDASLGQPEIRLGVFAPAASVLLPLRIGEARALTLLLHGAPIAADHALGIGLVDELADVPVEAARAWATPLLDHSASSLRFAHRALQLRRRDLVQHLLPEAEKLYLGELQRTQDAHVGLEAFLEKRTPSWTHN